MTREIRDIWTCKGSGDRRRCKPTGFRRSGGNGVACKLVLLCTRQEDAGKNTSRGRCPVVDVRRTGDLHAFRLGFGLSGCGLRTILLWRIVEGDHAGRPVLWDCGPFLWSGLQQSDVVQDRVMNQENVVGRDRTFHLVREAIS